MYTTNESPTARRHVTQTDSLQTRDEDCPAQQTNRPDSGCRLVLAGLWQCPLTSIHRCNTKQHHNQVGSRGVPASTSDLNKTKRQLYERHSKVESIQPVNLSGLDVKSLHETQNATREIPSTSHTILSPALCLWCHHGPITIAVFKVRPRLFHATKFVWVRIWVDSVSWVDSTEWRLEWRSYNWPLDRARNHDHDQELRTTSRPIPVIPDINNTTVKSMHNCRRSNGICQ